MFKCGECGCSITAENKIKRQKNGNVHEYIYYRCTKKKGACSQPHIRDGELVAQLSDILKDFALPVDWATELSKMADKDEKENAEVLVIASQAPKNELLAISAKLQRLLTAYLDQDIEREIYLKEKSDLLLRKKSLDEKIANLGRGSVAWLEPLREWIKDSVFIGETAVSPSLIDKKSSAQKIFGSHLSLQDRRIVAVPIPPSDELRSSRNFFKKTALVSDWSGQGESNSSH